MPKLLQKRGLAHRNSKAGHLSAPEKLAIREHNLLKLLDTMDQTVLETLMKFRPQAPYSSSNESSTCQLHKDLTSASTAVLGAIKTAMERAIKGL